MSFFPLISPVADVIPLMVSFTDSSVSTSNLTTYTFSSQALGTAAGNRKIVIAISTGQSAGTAGVASVTVAGNSATQHIGVVTGPDNAQAEIWSVDLAAGTTGDIVVTWNSARQRCGIGVWAVYGAGATAPTTNSDTDNVTPSLTLAIPAGGVAIACDLYMGTGAVRTFTWGGLTEDFDETMEPNTSHSGASDAFATEQIGLTISTTPSGSVTYSVLVAASWGPS